MFFRDPCWRPLLALHLVGLVLAFYTKPQSLLGSGSLMFPNVAGHVLYNILGIFVRDDGGPCAVANSMATLAIAP